MLKQGLSFLCVLFLVAVAVVVVCPIWVLFWMVLILKRFFVIFCFVFILVCPIWFLFSSSCHFVWFYFKLVLEFAGEIAGEKKAGQKAIFFQPRIVWQMLCKVSLRLSALVVLLFFLLLMIRLLSSSSSLFSSCLALNGILAVYCEQSLLTTLLLF